VTIQKQSHAVRSIAMKVKKDLKESSVCKCVCVFPGSTVNFRVREQESLAGICDKNGRVNRGYLFRRKFVWCKIYLNSNTL
jgi:hypothetical protein